MRDWKVEKHPLLAEEFEDFSESVQDELLAEIVLLEKYGPHLKRPHADTLKNSKTVL